ncbi:cytochrome c family protein [Salmonella enterica subsp. enterica]|nr:cytochrome c family protein [Salmonella enterica subsp. enterica serovar Enteritidis]
MKLAIWTSFAVLAALAAPAQAQDAEAGKKVFNRCKACHDIEQPKNKIGPHLDGVIGRKAGSLPDFAYSDAMKKAGEDGLVWDDAKIAEYMTNPKGSIPGNKMAFAGLKKPEDVANLIAYLKTFPAKQ